ncbi:MAG: TIGR00730 family Rossman fold protein [Myxococcota bacterium]
MLRRLCVYCGSSPGANEAITKATVELGVALASRGTELVYGGGAVGLMGLVADTVLAGGGRVTGVIPTRLFSSEVAHRGLTELIEVNTMHERKQAMFDHADGFLALPGGFGTLEELAEIVTWAQIGVHGKPVGLLNVDGYYDALVAWLDRAVTDGFLSDANRNRLRWDATVDGLLAKLDAG